MDSITHIDRSFGAAGMAAPVVSRLLAEEPQGELQQEREPFARAAQMSMLSEMTAYIAHEVNQPLAAIELRAATSLRRLARPTTDLGEVEEALKRIIADAHRASEIIGRIRAMATRRLPKPSLLSLDDDVVREALRFLREEFQSRAVAVTHFSSLGGDHKVLSPVDAFRKCGGKCAAAKKTQERATIGGKHGVVVSRLVMRESDDP